MSFSELKVGTYVILEDKFPCKIINIKRSAPGKHGHAKKIVIGKDMITDKKHEGLFTHHSVIELPNIKRNEYQLNHIDDDDYMNLMEGIKIREDVKLPDNELGEEIKTKLDDGVYINIILLEVSFNDKNFVRVTSWKEDTTY